MSEYNKDNAKGRYIADYDEFWKVYTIGDWTFRVDGDLVKHIEISIPDGSPRGLVGPIPILGENRWEWNGSKEAPTLTPSIDRHPSFNHKGWHGFLTNGELKSV